MDPHTALPHAALGAAELKIRLLPFLRQASLLMSTQFNLRPASSSASGTNLSASPPTSEFEKLCAFLSLPSHLGDCIDLADSVHSRLISGWCFMWHNSDKKSPVSSPVIQNIGTASTVIQLLFLFPAF